ncbi:MAG: inorganic phosphate transporter [Bacillaceae bacterium]|nr:inorganic phosphate transporter [Bacillaceae bacterium]
MQIFSTFEHSSYLELSITSLEKIGVSRENILTVPLINRVEDRRLFDTLHRADGISLFDKGAAIGTAFAVIGASVGFVLEWGPIYWGLIGATVGFILGFIIDYIIFKVIHNRKRVLKGKQSEVVLVVECSKELVDKVEEILWEHLALGVAKVE